MRNIIVASMTVLISSACMAKESHCAASESVYFSCRAGKNVISICSSKQVTANHGYMQYRFGEIGHIELEYPTNKVHPSGLFFVSYNTFSRGDESRISFINGKYKYVVFSRMVGNDPPRTGHTFLSGVDVIKDSAITKEILCSGYPQESIIKIPAGVLKDDPDFLQSP